MSSDDLQEKIDHGKEEQVEKTCNGKGQASRREEERSEKESPAGEGKGEEDRDEGCEAGSAQEGQANAQGRGQEGCAEAERAEASSCPAGSSGTDCGTALDAGRRHADSADDFQYRTDGVLAIRRREN